MLALWFALATQAALFQPALVPRTFSPAMAETETQCALIEMVADDPVRVALVLRQAWMEGGVKRGLTGTVLVPEDGKVQIVCQGELARLKSFAEWIETQRETFQKVSITEIDSCPVVPMSSRFPFADAEDVDAQPWRELLESISADVGLGKGSTQSNDEGLF